MRRTAKDYRRLDQRASQHADQNAVKALTDVLRETSLGDRIESMRSSLRMAFMRGCYFQREIDWPMLSVARAAIAWLEFEDNGKAAGADREQGLRERLARAVERASRKGGGR